MRSIITSTLIMLMIVGLVSADVPQLINYQGQLTNDGGEPVNGSKLMKFKIYGSPTGDDSLWSSNYRTIQINNGLFNYELGSNIPLPEDLFVGNDARYLGITVDTDAEIQPRTQFITVPYALHALVADSVIGFGAGWIDDGTRVHLETATDSVGIGTSSPSANLHITGGGDGPVVEIYNTNDLHDTAAVYVETDGYGAAVYGKHILTGNIAYLAWLNAGVYAEAVESNAYGVWGKHINSGSEGILGRNGTGVMGYSENGIGIQGWSPDGFAGYFQGRTYIDGGTGIGTIDIQGKLDINDAEDEDLIIFETGNVDRFAVYAHDSGTDRLTFRSKSENPDSDILTITGNRRIGINKTNPLDALDVGGHIRLDGGVGSGAFIRFAENEDLKWSFLYIPWHDSNLVLLDESGGNIALGFEAGTGYVGVGVEYPSEQLHVGGNICYTGSIGACSDVRYKTNIIPLTDALDIVNQIKPVKFDWKKGDFPENNFSDNQQIGFIAQELKEILPEVVSQDNHGYFNVDYSKLTPILVKAIKEQQKQIETLVERIDELEGMKVSSR